MTDGMEKDREWEAMKLKPGMFPSAISGFKFVERRELRPVATCWDFQTTKDFSNESARILLAALPEGFCISYTDPESDGSGQGEETCILVRRDDQEYYVQKVSHGCFSAEWELWPCEQVITSFIESPLVKKPFESMPSFTVATIPDHQRECHKISTPIWFSGEMLGKDILRFFISKFKKKHFRR